MKKQEAVALKYDQAKNKAPRITAKGKGKTAQKIIELAALNDIPIKKDEDLVELLSKVELDKEVPAEMYKAVAEVFTFIYNMTKKSE
ncbi:MULTISPECIES: EscU/YscU/HrcU family type III secretion system export apparatus switch protein [Sulfurimonas]|uniref:EscU/YscU/HrcU family type III secretion system export apparatus switch protein n=1 Tax=Sulfurimonas TaxID=202746 RepID=UPI00126405FB|nr:EscU/YscU/HrcU family type III secretion system export apparatus switch protein [Sulfurimonas indica]